MSEEPVELNDEMEIRYVSLDELKEQDINPRTMSGDMFNQLTENIKKRGKLESLPYCYETEDGDIEIISGHHRVKASRQAGLNEIPILLDVSGLERDEVIAKQLAHNSIQGEDDDQIIKRLYDEIDDVDRKIEAYISEDKIDMPSDEYRVENFDVGVDFHRINLMFLPTQIDKFERVVQDIRSDVDEVLISDVDNWGKFKEIVNEVKDIKDIKSISAVLSYMCDVVQEKLEEDEDE